MYTGYNITTKRNYPVMRMPKQELAASDYDEKCCTLIDSICRTYSFFMWFGEKPKNEHDEVRSIIFLDGLFLKMLVAIKDIYVVRGRKLYDEHTDQFKELLKDLNEQMHRGTRFIHKSSNALDADLGNDMSCVVAMRQDVVKGFRELAEWLHKETQNQQNKKRAKKLRDELELNYDMKMFGCMGDSFEQHTNMVMNALMLLAYPAIQEAAPEVYREMFDNTIAELQVSWKTSFDAWKKRILKAYDLHNIVEDKDKMKFLKDLWGEVDGGEEALLEQFNIEHDTARTDSERATMGLRIYENLNGDANTRMDTAALRQYLLYVMQKKYLDDEIDKLRPQPRTGKAKPATGKKRPPLWKSGVNLSALASCFGDVYCRYFGDGEKQEQLQGKHNDEVTLMAYLYIICKKEDYFDTEEKRAFFNFCKEEAGFTTAMSDKTFRNRLSKVEEKLRPHPLLGVDKTTDNNFHRIRRVFHGTKKFEAIKPLKKG